MHRLQEEVARLFHMTHLGILNAWAE